MEPLVAQMVKSLPAVQETQVRFPGLGKSLEKKRATHSIILAWRIPWMEEPDRLQSMGSQRVRHDWVTFTFKNYKMWSLPSKDLQSSQEYKTQANRAFIMQSHADCDIHCPRFLISFVWTFLDNLSLVLVADDHRWLYQPSFHVTSVHDAGKLKMWLPGLHCN